MARYQLVSIPYPDYVISEHSTKRKATYVKKLMLSKMEKDRAEVMDYELDIIRRRKSRVCLSKEERQAFIENVNPDKIKANTFGLARDGCNYLEYPDTICMKCGFIHDKPFINPITGKQED